MAAFIARRRTADPEHFPDLSLSIVKLMGPGLYEIQRPGQTSDGHFGLAVQDYTHSTAPNRRYADLVTQRLVKAVHEAKPAGYPDTELDSEPARLAARSIGDPEIGSIGEGHLGGAQGQLAEEAGALG